jgi:hypothetical protein
MDLTIDSLLFVQPIALLQQIPMAFNKRYGGGKEWLQLTKRPKSKVFLWRTLRRSELYIHVNHRQSNFAHQYHPYTQAV